MSDDDPRRLLLQRQLEIMWRFATDFVIDRVDLELALWEPSTNVCTVRQVAGEWVADWPDEDNGPLPDATIAWLLWHIEQVLSSSSTGPLLDVYEKLWRLRSGFRYRRWPNLASSGHPDPSPVPKRRYPQGRPRLPRWS